MAQHLNPAKETRRSQGVTLAAMNRKILREPSLARPGMRTVPKAKPIRSATDYYEGGRSVGPPKRHNPSNYCIDQGAAES